MATINMNSTEFLIWFNVTMCDNPSLLIKFTDEEGNFKLNECLEYLCQPTV